MWYNSLYYGVKDVFLCLKTMRIKHAFLENAEILINVAVKRFIR